MNLREHKIDNMFKVQKIVEDKDYTLVYGKIGDTNYKVVEPHFGLEHIFNGTNLIVIDSLKKGKKYNLELCQYDVVPHGWPKMIFSSRGYNTGIWLNESIYVSDEPDKGIFVLHYAKNLRGKYIVVPNKSK